MPRPEYGGGPNERGRSTGRAHRADHDTEDARDDRRGEDDKDDKGKRIDLSVAQVVGAGMATLTAATAASYLNVYGTVIGTAVMAVLSTSATPVIQHWITRSGERAKGLAGKAKHPHDAPFAERPESAIERDDLGATAAFRAPAVFQDPEDATRTMAMPSLGHDLPGRTLAHGFGNPADPDRPHDPVPGEPTELLPSVGPRDRSGAVASDTTGEGGTRPKRGLRAVLIPAGVVFVLVMLVVLAFELLTGRSLTAWTQGQDEPTSPSLLGGQSAPAHPGEDDEDDEDTDTSESDQGPQEEGTETAPGTGTEEPAEPGTTPGDQGTDTPTVPTDPAEPPAEEPEPELPEEPAEPGPGDGGQGGDAPQDGAPQNGARGESAPTG
ncbi:hypothetical protein [Nocardiopsis sp. NPDC006832]|uniref:hypothetical protein n=1 Tax=Nocardiopsis sp. NPDC006832 TaxID=3157188 RepID=UPI0033C06226